jgi:hypothetical protein
MKHLLLKARQQGIESIVILTHPFEYIKKADFQYQKVTKNRVNQVRLEKLCEFIKLNNQDFQSSDFSECYQEHNTQPLQQPLVKIPFYYSVLRKIHNKINDSIWSY